MRQVINILLISLFALQLSAQSDPNARDLRILTEWFEGEFDNDSQLWLEGRRDWKGNEEEKHERLHVTHLRIDAAEIGRNVFYVEEYSDDIDSVITRQRIVSFESDPQQGSMIMKIYFLRDGEKYFLRNNKGLFEHNLSRENLFSIDGCDLIFTRSGEQYEGRMHAKACQFGEGDLRRYSVHDVIISQHQYWRIDQTYLTKNDEFYRGNPSMIPYKMRKASYYNCDVSFFEKAYYLPSDLDKKYEDIPVHNQGCSKWIYNPIEEKRYMLQIREKEYPFYETGSDFLMIRFKAEDAVASNVIVTASPGTKNISFNIGTASANCTLQK